MFSFKKIISAAVITTASSVAFAGTTVITFDEDTIAGNIVTLQHGTVIQNQYQDVGVTVNVNNKGGGPNKGVLYNTAPGTDSADKNNDRDSDLTGPAWGNSNFDASSYSAGNSLVIQENNNGCGDNVCNKPDDQVGRSSDGLAGYITFNLDFDIAALGFDLIDFQADLRAPEVASSEVRLFEDAMQVQTFTFSDFINDANSALYGENSINRIFIDSFSNTNINKVEFKIFGTGAIDNLRLTNTSTQVPEPGTLALFGLALFGLTRLTRKK